MTVDYLTAERRLGRIATADAGSSSARNGRGHPRDGEGNAALI